MIWALYCIDGPNTADAREKLLKVHRDYLDASLDKIFFSGPLLSDDAKDSHGSLFILNVKGRKDAQAWIDSEPFYNDGIFAKVTLHRMRKGRFNPKLADVV